MPTATDDVIRMILGGTYNVGGKPMSNVFHFADTGAGGISDASFISNMGTILENIYGDVASQMSDKYIFTNIAMQNLTQALIIGTIPWPTFTTGSTVSPIDVAQMCGLVRMITPKPRVQGRIYLPGFPEASVANSALNNDVQVAMADLGVNLLAPRALGGSELTYCVYNQILKTFVLPTSTAFGVSTRGLNRRKLA